MAHWPNPCFSRAIVGLSSLNPLILIIKVRESILGGNLKVVTHPLASFSRFMTVLTRLGGPFGPNDY